MTEEKKNNIKQMNVKEKKDKKIHPFLFLLLLAGIGFGIFRFWQEWFEKSQARRLEDIVQSQDIAQLITGEGFNKKAFSEELENLKNVHRKERGLKENLKDVVQAFADIPDFGDDDVGLAMKGIQVSQGEKGTEEWRLFADWATMRRKTGVLQVENPLMWHRVGEGTVLFEGGKSKTMLLQDDAEKISIKSDHGIVYDNNTKVLLQDNVSASQNANRVEGPFLSYNSTERIAVFPEKADFQGEGISGSAEILSWNMRSNKIYGTGNVEVEWLPQD